MPSRSFGADDYQSSLVPVLEGVEQSERRAYGISEAALGGTYCPPLRAVAGPEDAEAGFRGSGAGRDGSAVGGVGMTQEQKDMGESARWIRACTQREAREYPAPGTVDFSGAIDGGGYKKRMDDPAKLQPSMIPPVFIEGVTQVLMFGARKYARGNWMLGTSFTDVLDAIKTHTLAVQRGEDLDTDSGLPHIYHIGCGLAFLSWYQYRPRAAEYEKFDDRLFKATEG